MTFILTSDLHFSDKSRDSHRFEIFEFLINCCLAYDPWALIILGDLTVDKDTHSATLVNKIVSGLNEIKESTGTPIYILMGNHDYIDPSNPFFYFLNNIEDLTFISKPRLCKNSSNILFLPHTKNKKEWANIVKKITSPVDYIVLHQTVDGAISESGKRLTGFSTKPLISLKPKAIYAGDIHKPQLVGPVEYIGPPYNIRFGEDFKPRVLIVDDTNNKTKSLYPDLPRKYLIKIRDLDELKENKFRLKGDDQVRIRMELHKEEAVDWPFFRNEISTIIKSFGAELFGAELKVKKSSRRVRISDDEHEEALLSHKDTFKGFCKREKLDSTTREIGQEILNV